MRIETQGRIDVDHLYQHVGYISAAMSHGLGGTRPEGVILSRSLFGASVLFLLLGLMAARRLRVGRRRTAVGVSLLLAVGAALASLSNQPLRLRTTLYRLEKLSAQTEQWTTQHGRPPSGHEWLEQCAGADAVDGWGAPFYYGVGLPPPPHGADASLHQQKGLLELATHWRYVISSSSSRDAVESPGWEWSLSTWGLGVDGLSGTPDDLPQLKHELGQTGLDKLPHSHGRTAREVG